MDMSQYSNDGSFKLRGHLEAIRENQVSVACMILYLHGYDFELTDTGSPLAGAARECLQELDKKGMTGVYSCSTKAGGIWSTAQRYMLKFGEER